MKGAWSWRAGIKQLRSFALRIKDFSSLHQLTVTSNAAKDEHSSIGQDGCRVAGPGNLQSGLQLSFTAEGIAQKDCGTGVTACILSTRDQQASIGQKRGRSSVRRHLC